MNKGILVMDTAGCCGDCKCSYIEKSTWICLARDGEEIGKDGIKPDWCPLRELPQKKEIMGMVGSFTIKDAEERARREGWNACIDEILKGGNTDE